MGLLVEGSSALPGAEEFQQFRRPDQAADMRREDTVGASLHQASRLCIVGKSFSARSGRSGDEDQQAQVKSKSKMQSAAGT
jgi:hypothetical protein